MAPFTVLHVCMGNICRSPMAERLLTRAITDRLTSSPGAGAPPGSTPGELAGQLVHSHSAGTGGWHAGEEMNPPAARQVLARGGDVAGFAARKLRAAHIADADLVLTATADQYDYVLALHPDAADHTFVLGEFGRLLATVDAGALPAAAPTPEAVAARGTAVVKAVHAVRAGEPSKPADDLDDPWGRGDQTFGRIGDEIEAALVPFAALLFP